MIIRLNNPFLELVKTIKEIIKKDIKENDIFSNLYLLVLKKNKAAGNTIANQKAR